MDKSKAGLAIGGLIAASAGIFLLLRKKVVPPPPSTSVSVSLINTPAGGELWYLTVWDQARTQQKIIIDIPVSQAITFTDVPQNWFPLPFFIVVYRGIPPVREQVGIYQSFSPDFTGYLGEVYIPAYGAYYYNVDSGAFEPI